MKQDIQSEFFERSVTKKLDQYKCRKYDYILPIFNEYEPFHGYDDRYDERVEIEPETICQYTGLNDKNGKRIWENDIISINTYDYMEPSEDFFGKVVYCEAWACWCMQQPDNEKPIPLCECEGSYQTNRFVEGNIFDNPKLLKEQ